MFGVAVALGGFYLVPATVLERILFLAGGLLMVDPGWVTDVAGVLLLGAAVASQQWRQRKMEKGEERSDAMKGEVHRALQPR